MYKTCSRCKQVKLRSDFYKQVRGRDGLHSVCKKCRSEQNVGAAQRKPKLVARRRRDWHLKSNFGLTEIDYKQMLASQGGGCAICGSPTPRSGRDSLEKNFPVDHNHITGEIRGLLCHPCNRALGVLVGDSQERLKTLVNYLGGFVLNV